MQPRPLPFGFNQRAASAPVVTHDMRARFAETAPVYQGLVRLLAWSHNSGTRMTAKVKLQDVEDAVRHPFKGLRWSKTTPDGQRLRIGMSQPVDEAPPRQLYNNEGSLAFWTEDPMGMSVTLRFDDGPDAADGKHPLDGFDPRVEGGVTLYLVAWAVGDDEMPVPPPQPRRGERIPFTQMDATRQSAIKCADEAFRRFCAEEAVLLISPDEAAALPSFRDEPAGYTEGVVRAFCGVRSRSVLRQDTPEGRVAKEKWGALLHRFGTWRAARREV